MLYLEQMNNKGKVAELKFARNMVAFLLEATVQSFVMLHNPILSHKFAISLALLTLNLFT